VGSEDYNQGLSERRADSVKSYLTAQGIGSTRITASGKGRSDPVADNESAAGRQQNRRVEVIISNPPTALR
jgi:outer membrane protein OmpA-like peptidoglycan-associated protein